MSPDVVPLPMKIKDKGHEALVSVWWTGMLMKRAFRQAFGDQFPSEAQFNALRAIAGSPEPLTQTEIAAKLMTDKANVTGLIDSMQAAGLAKRVPVEGDRRSKHVVLTPAGERLAERAGQAYLEKVRAAMSGLTRDEQFQLIELTRKVREGLVSFLD
jgi:DNA-binding MarR family transcriptional regulator